MKMNCSGCGAEQEVSEGVKSVLCHECTAKGIQPRFKDDKMNKQVKEGIPVEEVKKEPKEKKKKLGICKYIHARISEGKTNEEIVEMVKKDIPEYTRDILKIVKICRADKNIYKPVN